MTALDVASARSAAPARGVRDYGGRSGLPASPKAMRGAAVADFAMSDGHAHAGAAAAVHVELTASASRDEREGLKGEETAEQGGGRHARATESLAWLGREGHDALRIACNPLNWGVFTPVAVVERNAWGYKEARMSAMSRFRYLPRVRQRAFHRTFVTVRGKFSDSDKSFVTLLSVKRMGSKIQERK